MLISGYRKGLFKVLDAVCILAALSITGWFMLPADLSVLDDYTGASLFTVVSYLFFFYVLDAYNVGAEDFKDTTGRVLIAFFLGAIASASAFYAFQHWRFDRRTLLLLFSLCLLFCLGWRALYYKHIGRFVHKARILLIGTDRAGKVRQTISESLTDADIVGYVGDCDNVPAYAGMIPGLMPFDDHVFGVPRIRGDDPFRRWLSWKGALCSPHTRG